MILKKSTTYFMLLFLVGCATKINQKVNNIPDGIWITTDTLDDGIHITKGKYHKGIEVGKWTYKTNNKIDRKERYKKKDCIVKYYHTNGKLMKKGHTKTEYSEKNQHWYYDGIWHVYDEQGKLIFIKTFNKGTLIKTDSII